MDVLVVDAFQSRDGLRLGRIRGAGDASGSAYHLCKVRRSAPQATFIYDSVLY